MSGKFIVISGLNGCGKTSVSKYVVDKLNKECCPNWYQGDKSWYWEKEPRFFDHDTAHKVNCGTKNCYQREVMFLKDRLQHQSIIRELLESGKNILMDRYILDGVAYSEVYSKECHVFLEELYKSSLFIQPHFYIWMDTPIEVCQERREDTTIETKHKLRISFYWHCKDHWVSVLNLTPKESVEATGDKLISMIKEINLV